MLVTYGEVAALVLGLIAAFTVLGAAPASYVATSIPARWAIAPAIGGAIAIAGLTSALWFVSGIVVGWVILVPALFVFAWWAWRRRAELFARPGRDGVRYAVEIAIVIGFVIAVFGYPMALQHSLGPGGLNVYDGPNYVGMELAFEHNAIFNDVWGPAWDLSAQVGKSYGGGSYQQIGFTGVAGVVDAVTGVEPVRTQVPFMVALVLVGALGTFGAAAGTLARRWRPAPLVAGLLYAGPVLFQLVIDGSESALAGLMLMLPGIFVWAKALEHRGRAHWVVFAAISAGLQATYPILFPGFAVTCGVALLGYFAVRWWSARRAAAPPTAGTATEPSPTTAATAAQADPASTLPAGEEPAVETTRGLAKRLALGGLSVIVLTAAFAPPSFGRNLTYWKILATGEQSTAGLPQFDLPLPTMPGWLLGTREFYYLPHVSDVNTGQWLLTDVIPLFLIGIIVLAAFTRRSMWPFFLLLVITIVIAIQVNTGGCSYCVVRSLLPLGVLLSITIAAGITSIARFGGLPFARTLAALVAIGTLATVFHTDSVLARRGGKGAFLWPNSINSLLNGLKGQPGPVLIEGFGANVDGGAEFPAAYDSAKGGTTQRLVVIREYDENHGLLYRGGAQPSGATFVPDYRTIATRFGSIQTDRQVIRETDGVELQRRVKPFDVSLVGGFEANRILATEKRIFIHGPLIMRLVGPNARPAAVTVGLDSIKRAQVGKLPKGSKVTRVAGGVEVCIPTELTKDYRDLTIPLDLTASPIGYAPLQWFASRNVAVSGPSVKSIHVVAACG